MIPKTHYRRCRRRNVQTVIQARVISQTRTGRLITQATTHTRQESRDRHWKQQKIQTTRKATKGSSRRPRKRSKLPHMRTTGDSRSRARAGPAGPAGGGDSGEGDMFGSAGSSHSMQKRVSICELCSTWIAGCKRQCNVWLTATRCPTIHFWTL